MSFHELSILTGPAIPAPRDAAVPGLRVVVALPEQYDIIALSILLDLLAAANRFAGIARFTCDVVPQHRAAEAMRQVEGPLPARHLLLVADGDMRGGFPPDLLATLARVWQAGGRVGGWGAGCLALAEAGLLADGHFAMAADHRPGLPGNGHRLRPADQSFCDHQRVLTSVGKAILSDMVLHLIRQECGHQVMVGAMDHCQIHRSPGDGRLAPAPALAEPATLDPRIAAVNDWIDSNMARPFKACDLAAVAGLSVRQLERMFQRHMNRTPAAHLEHRRLSHALKLLRETDMAVNEIARSTGFLRPTAFRRRFRRKFGTLPG